MANLPDRYKNVIESLSGGGMSDPVVCQDAHLKREVVIKSLKNGVDPKRLLDELSALSSIRSKHVVQIYDVIKDDAGNVTAVVEEYLPGTSLKGGQPPKTMYEALALLYPVATGIADIHAHGRIHRDIKPDNMRRDAEGCIKIYDFGLAKMQVPTDGTKNLWFTVGYTAPEAFKQNKDGHYSYTSAVDVYAFEITSFELLSGAPLTHALKSIPPDTSAVNFGALPQNLPLAICELLKACVDTDPAARPDMAHVRHEIARHLLLDKHRATLVYQAKPRFLNATNRTAGFSFRNEAIVRIRYDGLRFLVTEVTGPVFINNMPVTVGFELPGACVIVMGAPELAWKRGILTVAVSHPEVTL